MSTRALIILRDGRDTQYFYRHSDGYPDGVMPTLEKFMSYVRDKKTRDNVSQSAGWLIVVGMQEYANNDFGRPDGSAPLNEAEPGGGVAGWKVGAYETTTTTNIGASYTYLLDLKSVTINEITDVISTLADDQKINIHDLLNSEMDNLINEAVKVVTL